MKTPERRNLRGSGVFIVNFEHISHLLLIFLFLTLKNKCGLKKHTILITCSPCKDIYLSCVIFEVTFND